jgi:LCP family protein required for cell wall assembly
MGVFMTQPRHSTDGFVPRRPGSQLGEHHAPPARAARPASNDGYFQPSRPSAEQPGTLRRSDLGIARSDLDESLRGIDSIDQPIGSGDKKGRGRKNKKPQSRRRKIIKRVLLALLIIVLAFGGYLAYKALHAGGNIFKGDLLGLIQNKPLKQDANGRSNILVLGTSEDDPGHQGANLTDSIMILSVDQKNKNAYMISIPRDLEVQYGQNCVPGSQGKINVYYSCVGGGENVSDDRAALTKTADFVGQNVVGMDIQYGVNVNYTVMRQLVNAVGGVTITIDSRDPRGQMDSNFDWKCGRGDYKVSRAEELRRCPPSGHFIDYPNGPVTLDAEHALYLAQARGDAAPTYGFEQSNFDREKNQQKIVKAIRDKAMGVGVLANFGKVTGILDGLGDNLRTTFETSEIRTLVSLAKDIKDKDIQSISLIDGDSPIMDGDAQPAAGKFEFGPLQALLKKKLSKDPAVREGAHIVVLNGSGESGVAQTQADKLTDAGLDVTAVDTAPEGNYGDVEVYQVGNGMNATKAKLESIFKTKVKTTAPPVDVVAGTNFVIIFGKDPSSNN